ncbi:sigma-70 family RNA polymerase sigma factor [Streptomyces sp. NPDC002328]|uniref:sigma-70 family RNA polymerase sigma factor n=1 Tax=Streptomyces sp. NPDC002328 TaxID=3364642 RepID=UPI0036BA761C
MGVDGRDESLDDGEARAGDRIRPQVPSQGGRTGGFFDSGFGSGSGSGEVAARAPAYESGVPAQRERREGGFLPPLRETPPADADLIARMRSGDDTAYEELYRRHADAVRRYARTCCRDAHTADDLTAEVFARMLQAVRGGSGPQHAVRAYLLTSVRRVAAGWTRSAKREQLVDDFAVFAAQAARSPEVAGADVRAMHEAEQSMAMRAFRSLPERWQAVLWHTEVEDESPSEVAVLFGLDANGTRVLASRAREGLKQAYLQAHVSATLTGDEECARYADQLGTYARRRLRTRAERGLRKHLEECARCRLAALQIEEVAGSIPAVVPLAVLGWLSTTGYAKTAALLAGGVGVAGVGGAAGAAGGVGAAGAGSTAGGVGTASAGSGAGAAGSAGATGAAGAAGAAGSAGATGGAGAAGAGAAGSGVAGAGAGAGSVSGGASAGAAGGVGGAGSSGAAGAVSTTASVGAGGSGAVGAGVSGGAAGGGGGGGVVVAEGVGGAVKAGVAAGVVAVAAVAVVALALVGDDDPGERPEAAPSVSAPVVLPEEATPTLVPTPTPTPTSSPASGPLAPAGEEPEPGPPAILPVVAATPTHTPAAVESPPPVDTPSAPGPQPPSDEPTPTPSPSATPTPTPPPPPAPSVFQFSKLSYDVVGDGSGPEIRLGRSSWVWQRGRLSIAERHYTDGVTVHGASSVTVELNRACTAYDAMAGVDDLTPGLGKASAVTFAVQADGVRLWTSDVVNAGDPAVPVHVNLAGRSTVRLVVEPHGPLGAVALADWAESRFTCS